MYCDLKKKKYIFMYICVHEHVYTCVLFLELLNLLVSEAEYSRR